LWSATTSPASPDSIVSNLCEGVREGEQQARGKRFNKIGKDSVLVVRPSAWPPWRLANFRVDGFQKQITTQISKNSTTEKALMAAPLVYRLRTELLSVDRETRTFVLLEPGSLVTYISKESQRMVVPRWDGREILAFAVDLANRAEPVQAADA
jgi:hypothetical protein